MGRAARKNNIPEALRELQEEGLPSGWQEFWQGSKDAIAPDQEQQAPISPLFPRGAEIPVWLGQQPIDSTQRIAFLAMMRVENDTLPSRKDPVLAALLRSEWQRVEGEPWAANYQELDDRERLFDIWERKVLQELPHVSQMMGAGKHTVWWSSNEQAIRRMMEQPSSLLAAALLDAKGPFYDEQELASSIFLKSHLDNFGDSREWFHDHIMPELYSLAGGPHFLQKNGGALSSLWERLRKHRGAADTRTDVQAHHLHLLNSLRAGGGDSMGSAFQKYPLCNARTIYEEAFHCLPWEGEILTDNMAVSAEMLATQQLARIYYGFSNGNPPDAGNRAPEQSFAWEEHRQKVWQGEESALSPLESFRPLFRGEDKEEIFDNLQKRINNHVSKQGSLLSGSVYIEDALTNHFDLQYALQHSFSEAIQEALVKEYSI